MNGISIIIVNYNSGKYLADCISSLTEFITVPHEIILWDNNSTDDSVKLAEHKNCQLKIIRCEDNLGFARANNQAVLKAEYKVYHFLNPDTLVNKQLDEVYQAILDSPKGIYVTKLTDSNGKQLKITHALPLLGNYRRLFFRSRKTAYWTIGASIIMTSEAFQTIGGWAEDYFMYSEDLDLFYTATKYNIPVKYVNAEITHIGRVSSGNTWSDFNRALNVEVSYRKFYSKHKLRYQYYILRPLQLLYMLFLSRKEFGVVFRAFVKTLFLQGK